MNWKTIVDELLKRGETYASIGREVGITSANVRMLVVNDGQQPRWPTGDKLIRMHKRLLRKYPKIDDVA